MKLATPQIISRLFATQFLNAMLVVSTLTFGFLSADLTAAPKDTKVQEVKSIVNINKASAEELAAILSGVGLKKANAIVQWRNQNGKFTSVEQLAQVKGIGLKTIAKNQALIRL